MNPQDNTISYRYPHDDELTLSTMEDVTVRVCYVRPKGTGTSTNKMQRSPWPHVPKDLKLKATETRVTFDPVVSEDTPVKTGQKDSSKGSAPTKYLTYQMASGLTFHLREDVRHAVCELFFTPESCEVRSVAELCLDSLLKVYSRN